MLISAVIPTNKREDKLAKAVMSILSQDIEDADIEVIVVNDAGEPLQPADWQKDPRVLVCNTNHTERAVARNTGAALSKGDYIAFLDDDDERLPGAFAAMLDVAHKTQADWIYGSYEEVDDDGNHIRVCRPIVRGNIFALVIAGAAVPVQASMIKRDTFFKVGAFDNRFHAEEDTELLQRISILE
ncbi:MAG: glycosyltransferase family 2 protein [Armatimonadota bacterium]